MINNKTSCLNDYISGHVAIVTGGGNGIGKAICLTLATKGATVIIADKDMAAAKQTSEIIGNSSVSVELDIASEESILKLYDFVEQHFDRLDVLVNNAGIFSSTPIVDITVQEWDLLQTVNLRGTFLMSREALKMMQSQRYGRIINIASMSAKTGGIAAGAHYSASKAAMVCFTKSLAMQAAEYDICVNAITPGLIKTDLTQAWGEDINAKLIERIPLKKFGQPQDVAEMVAFLASQRGRYLTGEIIDINGGLWMD